MDFIIFVIYYVHYEMEAMNYLYYFIILLRSYLYILIFINLLYYYFFFYYCYYYYYCFLCNLTNYAQYIHSHIISVFLPSLPYNIAPTYTLYNPTNIL